MSKKNRKQKHKGGRVHSTIAQHKNRGKKLVPPLNTVSGTSFSSWRDDHAPEMLWAFLIATTVPRDQYLNCFRTLVNWVYENLKKDEPPDLQKPKSDEPISMACELDLTSLSQLSDEHFNAVCKILFRHRLGYGALRPMLLIEALPGRERWRAAIGVDATEHDWTTLAHAVIPSLDHQSEISTDIRWLRVMTGVAMDRLRMPPESINELVKYPNDVDLHAVRPSIRATEIIMRRNPPSAWIESYWRELLDKTKCVDGSTEDEYFKTDTPPLALKTVLTARAEVIERFSRQNVSTRVDARLDSAFGFVLNALSILEEISAPPISQLISGRLGLRALAEIVITFSYLANKDDPTLWATYRSYGSGQAKLAFLKLEETAGDLPRYVQMDTLEAIVNEDVWQEFLDMDLGHWANSNLRDLAIEADVKDIYDRYYGWTSTFMHSQWGAVRDSNFVTCHNVLHRLHRIPRPAHRLLPNVVPDAAALLNQSFALLEALYPGMDALPRFEPRKQDARPAGDRRKAGNVPTEGAPEGHQENKRG